MQQAEVMAMCTYTHPVFCYFKYRLLDWKSDFDQISLKGCCKDWLTNYFKEFLSSQNYGCHCNKTENTCMLKSLGSFLSETIKPLSTKCGNSFMWWTFIN